ncbi:MAG: imidazolonepropionase [Polyangiaceae bacterium]
MSAQKDGREVRCVVARRLVTCDPVRSTPANPLGAIEGGAFAFTVKDGNEGGMILAAGEESELRARFPDAAWERHPDAVVTPGLVDAHTHAAWVGSRDNEYALRMAGADYEAIAKAGGGIVASMRSIRSASEEEIAIALKARLLRMAKMGVTAVEVKSGYGLDEENEHKQLGAIDRMWGDAEAPRVVPTFLGLHALPAEANGDRDGYAAHVAERVLPAVIDRGRAMFVDAYVDRSAFSVTQARPLFEKARKSGLGVRIHAGQFADVGGCELAADVGALSADHLEHVGENGIARMAEAGVRAVLLPIASFTLRQDPPPIAALRAAGVPLVVASDANPGTAPTESLPLAMALAVRMYGLTVAETILGATREAAASLGLSEHAGVLCEDRWADFVVWDLPHENALVQPWGVPRARHVVRAGHRIAGA